MGCSIDSILYKLWPWEVKVEGNSKICIEALVEQDDGELLVANLKLGTTLSLFLQMVQ